MEIRTPIATEMALLLLARTGSGAAARAFQARPAEDHADCHHAHREGHEDESRDREDDELVHGQALSEGSAAKVGVRRSAKPSARRSMKYAARSCATARS